MTMIRATMARWPQESFGFADADDGSSIFIHQNVLIPGQIATPRHLFIGRRIECEIVEGRSGSTAKYSATSIRFVDEHLMPVAETRTARPLQVVKAPDIAPQSEKPLPKTIAKALGLINEPQRRMTKRDRVKGI